jgi:tetratricopeptide (TPR) repeat protein
VSSVGASAGLLAAFLVYVLQASVDWLWQTTAVTVLALGGVAVAAAKLSHARPKIPWYGRAAIALVAVCAALMQLPGLLSTAELRRSQAAERAGNGSLAYSWANAAVSAEPWAASLYEQRGLVLESAGRLAAAAADLKRAVSHEPGNFRHWLLLARFETERGNVNAAIRDYTQARQLRPQALVFQYAPYFSRQSRRR